MILFLLLSAIVAIAATYLTSKAWKVNQHWKKLGVPHAKPLLFFGNMFQVVIKRKTQAEVLKDLYEQFPNEPIIGFYNFVTPMLIIQDLELIERVFIKDFPYFVDRGPSKNVKVDPLNSNLFSLTGNQWRTIRSRFTPMFTTGKLRYMFPQINRIGSELIHVLEKNMNKVDIREETGKFTIDVVGSCVFSIDPGAMDGEENEFRREAKIVFRSTLWDFIRIMVLTTMPKIARVLKLTFAPRRSISYFTNVVRQALDYRKQSKEVRCDFVQLMVDLQEKGYLEVEKNDPNDEYLRMDDKTFFIGDHIVELTDDVMVGQAFAFLVAGFDATASTMMFMCLELAANPEAQNKAREEILKTIAQQGELTYNNVRDMRYLDCCFRETLRIHSPVGVLVRMCIKNYKFPGIDLPINEGDTVMIPVLGLHTDPKIYPDPNEFLPNRWNVANAVKRPPCTYLPFGDGPRVCIGMRFAIMEIKCCIAKILANFKIKLHPSVELPVKLNPHSFFTNPLKPVLFNLEKLH